MHPLRPHRVLIAETDANFDTRPMVAVNLAGEEMSALRSQLPARLEQSPHRPDSASERISESEATQERLNAAPIAALLLRRGLDAV